MTRNNRDWQQSAQDIIEGRLDGVATEFNRHDERVSHTLEELREAALANDPDPDEVRHRTSEAVAACLDLGNDGFNWGYMLYTITSGRPIDTLTGDEPVGYSKSDGGAAHNAYYGSLTANAKMNRELHWPLRLDEWDKTVADGDADPRDPVTAEGSRKFHKSIDGRDVYVVIDDRGWSPI